MAELQGDIAAAYHARDWEALGYDSWDAYVSGEFGSAMPRLDRAERRELVVNLRAEGLSTRAIAAATGVAQQTVNRDLAGDSFESPEPTPIIGTDGKTYEPRSSRPDMISDRQLAELNAGPAKPPITAEELDALKPKKVEPVKPRRRPITDQAEDAGWEIRKAADRVARILDDDRVERNEEQVARVLRGHLLFVQNTVATALERLGDDNHQQ